MNPISHLLFFRSEPHSKVRITHFQCEFSMEKVLIKLQFIKLQAEEAGFFIAFLVKSNGQRAMLRLNHTKMMFWPMLPSWLLSCEGQFTHWKKCTRFSEQKNFTDFEGFWVTVILPEMMPSTKHLSPNEEERRPDTLCARMVFKRLWCASSRKS